MPENQTPHNEDPSNQDPNQPDSGRPLSYDDVMELLPVFVLGALEPHEMLAVESYLNRHQALVDRLTELEATMAQLAYAAPQTPLPGRVKTRLRQRVQADLAAQPTQQRTAPVAFPPRRRAAPQPQRRAFIPPPAPLRPEPRNWFGFAALTLVGVGVAVALLLLAINTAQLRGTLSPLVAQLATAQQQLAIAQQQLTAAQQQVAATKQQLATAQQQLTQLQGENSRLQTINQSLEGKLQNQRMQLAVLTHPERAITLAGQGPEPHAEGTFFIRNNTGMLVLGGLAPLPANQTYQFWLIPAGQSPRPAGLIQVTSSEPDTLIVEIPPQYRDFANIGLSIEPAGGSPAPTGAIVLLG
jgi:anti-sigma-K factor RskA